MIRYPFIFILLLLLNIKSVYGFNTESISENSGLLKDEKFRKVSTDTRVNRLRNFLGKYGSPLADESEFIISISDAYQLPWTIIPAIAGVESTFCKNIPWGSSNCWGWNNGNYNFLDFEDGIHTVAKGLKYNYFDYGLNNPYAIQRKYAPPSTTWGSKVNYFMNLIESYPAELTSRVNI